MLLLPVALALALMSEMKVARQSKGAGEAAKVVERYHEASKHYFDRYAQSKRMDWSSQPSPYRVFGEATFVEMPFPTTVRGIQYSDLWLNSEKPRATLSLPAISNLLFYSLALSAKKRAEQGSAEWFLRVNPSSGNLHPTEAYVMLPSSLISTTEEKKTWLLTHYSPDKHALQHRARLGVEARKILGEVSSQGEAADVFFVALTSIYWRESWKYGVRGFRYCALDIGHAVAAIRFAAALNGWKVDAIRPISAEAMETLLGLDRNDSCYRGERERFEVLLRIRLSDERSPSSALAETITSKLQILRRKMVFFGSANNLSPVNSHVVWKQIDTIASATPDRLFISGAPIDGKVNGSGENMLSGDRENLSGSLFCDETEGLAAARPFSDAAASVIRKRRSAHAFDSTFEMEKGEFIEMMRHLVPRGKGRFPWDTPFSNINVEVPVVGVFVHRVRGLPSGQYILIRDSSMVDSVIEAGLSHFVWQRIVEDVNLFLVFKADATHAAGKVSCDQDIARRGCFLAACFAEPLNISMGEDPHRYRRKFWESGFIGHMLYLDAHAAGIGATGIGCFEDEPMRNLWWSSGHFQPLYHVAVGKPINDERILTTEPYDKLRIHGRIDTDTLITPPTEECDA